MLNTEGGNMHIVAGSAQLTSAGLPTHLHHMGCLPCLCCLQCSAYGWHVRHLLLLGRCLVVGHGIQCRGKLCRPGATPG